MYDIKTLDVKAGVCVNFNNLPTDFEEKHKNLEETINTCGEKMITLQQIAGCLRNMLSPFLP